MEEQGAGFTWTPSHRSHFPSSQQHANLPLPCCRLCSIQECFTRLWSLSCVLVREPWITFPFTWQNSLEGLRIGSKIPTGVYWGGRAWHLNNQDSATPGCNFRCPGTVQNAEMQCWDSREHPPFSLLPIWFLSWNGVCVCECVCVCMQGIHSVSTSVASSPCLDPPRGDAHTNSPAEGVGWQSSRLDGGNLKTKMSLK